MFNRKPFTSESNPRCEGNSPPHRSPHVASFVWSPRSVRGSRTRRRTWGVGATGSGTSPWGPHQSGPDPPLPECVPHSNRCSGDTGSPPSHRESEEPPRRPGTETVPKERVFVGSDLSDNLVERRVYCLLTIFRPFAGSSPPRARNKSRTHVGLTSLPRRVLGGKDHRETGRVEGTG